MLAKATVSMAAVGIATLAVACAAPGPRVGQSTTVQFGTVRSAQPVTLNSAAAEGAIIGGTLGLISGGGRRSARNAIVGASIGGVAGGAGGGNRMGMAYTVDLLDGASTRVVTDQREIQMGDCVAVERVRDTANIRRVAEAYCDTSNREAVAAVSRSDRSEAVECQSAKEELAAANTDAAADLAIRKIELLCSS